MEEFIAIAQPGSSKNSKKYGILVNEAGGRTRSRQNVPTVVAISKLNSRFDICAILIDLDTDHSWTYKHFKGLLTLWLVEFNTLRITIYYEKYIHPVMERLGLGLNLTKWCR